MKSPGVQLCRGERPGLKHSVRGDQQLGRFIDVRSFGYWLVKAQAIDLPLRLQTTLDG
jgi:hypothetical protein